MRNIKHDRSIRALVISGAGGHFCSGGDLRNIAKAGLDNQGWRERLRDLHGWLQDLITLDRPVIAAVDGAAFGAGFGLALAADFVIATTRARFCVSFLRVGLVPDFGTFYTLPRIVGPQRAKELMLSAREVGAEEALRLGIAMELHPPEQLLARAQAIGAELRARLAGGGEPDQACGGRRRRPRHPAGTRGERAGAGHGHTDAPGSGAGLPEQTPPQIPMAGLNPQAKLSL